MVGADGIEPPSAGRRPAVMTTLLSARGAPRGIKPRCAGLGNPLPSQRRGRMVGVEGLAPPSACSQSKPSAADLHPGDGAHDEDRTRRYRMDSAAPSPVGYVRMVGSRAHCSLGPTRAHYRRHWAGRIGGSKRRACSHNTSDPCCWSTPHIGAHGAIRTLTGRHLKPFPLPVGIRARCWCPVGGSNPCCLIENQDS